MQNFPTVGLIDGTMRAGLEETGMGYGLEVDMIRQARELDLLTVPVRLHRGRGARHGRAPAPTCSCRTWGSRPAARSARRPALTLDEAVERVQALRDAAAEVNPDILCLCHGGPIAEPDDAQYVLDNTTGIVGFFGASSMERLPTEIAMTENMRRFKSVEIGRRS